LKGVLHHIEIYVSDIAESEIFWTWLLEELSYKKFQEFNGGFSFKLNDTYIVFVQTEEKYLDIKYHRKRTGLNHLAFYVNSKQDVDDIIKKLKQRNINILYPEKHPFAGGDDYYAVFFEDPDRIKIELVALK